MNRVATQDPKNRSVIFNEGALRLKMPVVIVEKDFWVCWMLGVLFGGDKWREVLVFKGGTSLSKVFGAIRRFSEDIDLSLAPSALGIVEDEGESIKGRNKRERWMKEMESRCCNWVKDDLSPALEKAVSPLLGRPPKGMSWVEYEYDQESKSPTILFHYPCVFPEGSPYIRRFVKPEFGSLTNQQPTGWHTVRPWLADALPSEMRGMGCQAVSLEVERTFWEKATILHAEHYRDIETPMPEHYSRHYADLAALANSSHGSKALRDIELLQRVAEWKNRFFARSWARYDLAVPGTLRLLPRDERIKELVRDYREMREMFLDEPQEFAAVMHALKTLEHRINSGTHPASE